MRVSDQMVMASLRVRGPKQSLERGQPTLVGVAVADEYLISGHGIAFEYSKLLAGRSLRYIETK